MQTHFKASAVPLLFRVLNPQLSNDHQFALATIEGELDRLFNTRSRVSMEDYEDLGGTIFGYGIPNFSHVSPDDPISSARLTKVIELAVQFHEPRVIDPVVKLVGLTSDSSLSITLEGDVLVENKTVRLKFFGPDRLFQ